MSAESQHVGRCSKCTSATSYLRSRLETSRRQKQLNGHFQAVANAPSPAYTCHNVKPLWLCIFKLSPSFGITA